MRGIVGIKSILWILAILGRVYGVMGPLIVLHPIINEYCLIIVTKGITRCYWGGGRVDFRCTARFRQNMDRRNSDVVNA